MAAITFLMSSLARLRVSARTERPDMARAAPQHRPRRTRRRTRSRARALRGTPARCAFCVTTPDTPRLLRLRRHTRPTVGTETTRRRGDGVPPSSFGAGPAAHCREITLKSQAGGMLHRYLTAPFPAAESPPFSINTELWQLS